MQSAMSSAEDLENIFDWIAEPFADADRMVYIGADHGALETEVKGPNAEYNRPSCCIYSGLTLL